MNLDEKIREKLADWHRQYFGTAHPLINAMTAVIDLHSPGEGELCEGYCVENDHPDDCRCDDVVIYRCPICVKSWIEEQTQDAPCSTVAAIARELGVTPDA